MKPETLSNRRRFLKQSAALAGAALASQAFGLPNVLKAAAPNERLNIAGIGVGGQGAGDLNQCAATENIVALADVDANRAAGTIQRYEKASKYTDFRKMLDKEAKNIDAVVIATPDHMHATAALWCMERGKGVYVEKPLTRTPWEARLLTQAAAKYKVATQMGNQGFSHEATRVAAEILWSGEIGDVTEVHAWTGAPSWPQGLKEWPAEQPVPSTLDWDLWLGGAPARPYSSAIAPFNWRGFYDYGTGPLGDWGIHIFGPAQWGLRLTAPTSIEVVKQEGKSPVTFPSRSVLRYDFPARGSMPAVKIYWYDATRGADPYTPPGLTLEDLRPSGNGPVIGAPRGGRGGRGERGGAEAQRGAGPQRGRGGAGGQGSGVNQIFVGSKGFLGTSGRGEGVRLLPDKRWAEYRLPPQFLTRSPGHVRDWLRACKGGESACSNFSIAGPYAEWVTLGAVAYRVEGKLEWDAAKMQFTNNADANRYVQPEFRKGWELRL